MALQGWSHGGNYRKLTRATTSDVWTVAAWVYPTSSVQYMTPIETMDSGLVGILRSGAGSYWTADYSANASNYSRNTGISVDLNTWQLVVATINATTSTNQFVVYKGVGGGITSDSWSTIGGATSKTLTNWYQYQTSVGGRQFVGRIALAGVWNAVLSASDVTALYNGGVGVDPATIQPSFIRISNYFDDQELSIDGATDGSSTYTDFGTLTTVAGPFSLPSTPFTGTGEIGTGEAVGLAGAATLGSTFAGSVGAAEAVGLAGSATLGSTYAGTVGAGEAVGLAGTTSIGGALSGQIGAAEAVGLAGSSSIGGTWSGAVSDAEAEGLAGSATIGTSIAQQLTGNVGDGSAVGLSGGAALGTTLAGGIGESEAAGLAGSGAFGTLLAAAAGEGTALGLAGGAAIGSLWAAIVGEGTAEGLAGTFLTVTPATASRFHALHRRQQHTLHLETANVIHRRAAGHALEGNP